MVKSQGSATLMKNLLTPASGMFMIPFQIPDFYSVRISVWERPLSLAEHIWGFSFLFSAGKFSSKKKKASNNYPCLLANGHLHYKPMAGKLPKHLEGTIPVPVSYPTFAQR